MTQRVLLSSLALIPIFTSCSVIIYIILHKALILSLKKKKASIDYNYQNKNLGQCFIMLYAKERMDA